MSNQTIDVEATAAPAQPEPVKNNKTMAVARVESRALGQALSVEELGKRLDFIRQVMRDQMKEGVDYGKIPGTGEKPTLLQPGAQKLLMVFNLREQVKNEVLREHPGLHREYEFTITVFPSGGRPETDGSDGVGTCSTLESKYRYRKAEKNCPQCGKAAIIQGKAEYGGGWVCWKKKGGCDAKFQANDPRITSQGSGKVENPDPADNWNTVRKMGFKRGLVAAVINFTNTSELWTQDLEDMRRAQEGDDDDTGTLPKQPQKPAGAPTTRPPAQKPQQPPAKAQPTPAAQATPPKPKHATAETKTWFIRQLRNDVDVATDFYRKLENPAVLLPNERLEHIPMEFVPISLEQLEAVKEKLIDFGNGADAEHPFPPNPRPEPKEKPATKPAAQPAPAKQAELPPQQQRAAGPPATNKRDPEWFFDVICPIPHKGEKKVDYDKNPDTIGSLYEKMKANDQNAQHRLWGFARHWFPQERTHNGQKYPPTEQDKLFREALDAFCNWHDKHGRDTQPQQQPQQQQQRPPSENPHPSEPERRTEEEELQRELAEQNQGQDDDVPF